jgi:death-on-curing protein
VDRYLFLLGINGHPLGEPLDEDAAEQFVIDVVAGKLELQQIASNLVKFAA